MLGWEAPLRVGGAVGILAAGSQLYNILHEGDLSAPIGRFAVMRVALPHIVPLVAGSALLLVGAWRSESLPVRRALKAGCLVLGVAALGVLISVLPDAASMAPGIRMDQLTGFRIQVIRSLLLFGVSGALFVYAGLKLPSQPAVSSSN